MAARFRPGWRTRRTVKAHTVRGPAFPPALSCAETWICRCSSAWRPEGLLLLDPGAPAQVRFPPEWLPKVPRFPSAPARLEGRLETSGLLRWSGPKTFTAPWYSAAFLGRPPLTRLDSLGGNRPRDSRDQLFRRL